MKAPRKPRYAAVLAALVLLTAGSPARAEMVLSQVIVDMQPGKPGLQDIEVWNAGNERLYATAEPFEIRQPGLPGEQRVASPDPTVSGLLVTPQRLVLEPDQRRLLRVSAIAPPGASDRIYRITIRPVAGPVTSAATALKVFVGYDVLVLRRPQLITGEVTASRSGRQLTLRNASNTAQEVYEGKQCDAAGANCKDLPATRLYSQAELRVALPYDTPAEYRITSGNGSVVRKF
jgi:Mat/Ecp fimbriae periplasmic chaperone